jgi:hypothetical protein
MEAQFVHVLHQLKDCRTGRMVPVVLLVLQEPLRTLTALCEECKIR